jgi:hypothetical protein
VVSRPRPAGQQGQGGQGAQRGQAAQTGQAGQAGQPAQAGQTAGQPRQGRGPGGPGLTRGSSGYDAALRWANPSPEPDLAGYAVVIRSTTSPMWEREIFVGNVTEYTLPDLSIDDVVIGVKSIDKDGNQSLVSAYEQAPIALGQPPAATTPATPRQ